MDTNQETKITRRKAIKQSALLGSAFLIGGKATSLADDPPPSPATTPWVQPLSFPPSADNFLVPALNPLPIPANHQRYSEFIPTHFYDIPVTEFDFKAHPSLPFSKMWGYGGAYPGVTFSAPYQRRMMVRFRNQLPVSPEGFGNPDIITHVHNGHHASESDGFPADFYGPGFYKDHHYPNILAGNDPKEAKCTLWYHDHRQDFTAQNTYKGLAGFYILFDELDSGNENDPNPNALRLPSGLGQFDIPLVFHDRRFDPNGFLYFDHMTLDGILGDKWLVNGRVQPFFNVQRRKYRFRLLNGGPSRFYEFWLSNSMDFKIIANDGNLLAAPVTVNRVLVSVAERMDIIIDFSQLPATTNTIYLVNRAEQTNGRGPTGDRLPMNEADRLLRFNIQPGTVNDPSQVPAVLRQQPAMDLPVAKQRLWEFDRKNGMWTVNNMLFDESRVDALVKRDTAEIWTLKNKSGGWSHPIHIHMEEYRAISRNGQTPPVHEQGRKDVFRLGPNEEVKIYMKFRDWLGRYPMHCHNTIHEDHAMMIRWDIIP
jgi:FtsP/CotA-like multicopper oxidase with cupredoxin domain